MYKTAVWKDQKHLIIKLYCRDWDEYCFQRRKRGIKTKSWLRNKVKKTLHKNQIQTEQISQTFGCKNEICVSPPGDQSPADDSSHTDEHLKRSHLQLHRADVGRGERLHYLHHSLMAKLWAKADLRVSDRSIRPPSPSASHSAYSSTEKWGVKTIGLTLSCHVPDNTTRNDEWFIAILKFTPLQFYRANIAARLL